uniref:Murein endopeptidase K n=1 Tax=Rhizobium leguminosarum TaxID=384 RepID=A0A179BFS8_RHILE|nr:hypothetical protein A4U53_30455 [Rhizobium leguminosarum]
MALRSCLLLGCTVPTWSLSAASAAAEDRSLKLYFVHTGERAVITFKRDGAYDQNGLNQLNRFLRDWRRNETIKMDPLLFDIVWEMYRRSGANDYVNVVSGYRSPNTNAMLRSRSSGVAKESQHTRGKAIDFFIPGVKLATLRGLGMQMQGGGVGYYPTSGSPFVHIDVGRVRAWPRMSRQELVRLFPNGRTLHIPTDGRPLPGYEIAVAEYKHRGSVSTVEVASAAQTVKRSKGSLLGDLFSGRDAEDEDEDDAADAGVTVGKALTKAGGKAEEAVVIASESKLPEIKAPIPATRPIENVLLTSLLPTETHPARQALEALASNSTSGAAPLEGAIADKIPLPTFAPGGAADELTDEILTASINPLPDAIAALSDVPLPPVKGAAALLTPPDSTDHLPTTSFSVSYKAKAFWTASFTPTAVFNSHRFGDDPCPSMTASTSAGATGKPC